MPNEPMNDPRRIWQNQPKGPFKMSVDEIRRKSDWFQTKARLGATFSIVMGLALSIPFARASAQAGEMFLRIGWGVLCPGAIYFAYQSYKWIWPKTSPPEAPVSTSLEFYRNELEKRRDYGRHIWVRSGLTFCFLGLGLIVIPQLIKVLATPRLLVNALPVFVLLAIWLAIFFPVQKREQQKLEQEIEELRRFEKDNRG